MKFIDNNTVVIVGLILLGATALILRQSEVAGVCIGGLAGFITGVAVKKEGE
jgi:hypothetical protein